MMCFGDALKEAKKGKKIYRQNWNGNGLVFVVYREGYPKGQACDEQASKAWNIEKGSQFKTEPYLEVKTEENTHIPYFPTIKDILAEDWSTVEIGEKVK